MARAAEERVAIDDRGYCGGEDSDCVYGLNIRHSIRPRHRSSPLQSNFKNQYFKIRLSFPKHKIIHLRHGNMFFIFIIEINCHWAEGATKFDYLGPGYQICQARG